MKNCTKWVFGLSLAANIFMIGMFGGYLTRQLPPPPPPPGGTALQGTMSKLSPESQQKLRAMQEENRAQRDADREKMRGLRDEIVAVLEAPEFDEKAFMEKSNALTHYFSESKKRMAESMAKTARNASLEERKAIAEQLKRPPMMRGDEGPPPPHGHGHGPRNKGDVVPQPPSGE